MRRFEEIAVVGGGPAGAYCAYELSKQGFRPTIFDHSHPREKPCGGGISPPLLARFPFVEGLRGNGRTFGEFKVISCIDTEVVSRAFEDGFAISRQLFDQKLLEMATDSDATLVKEKVTDVKKKGDHWILCSGAGTFEAKLVIGADGVHSIIRRRTVGAIPPGELAVTYGYIARCTEKKAIIKFLAEVPGYIWVFPGKDTVNIGVGSQLEYGAMLKPLLDKFIASNLEPIEIQSSYAACLPSASNPEFFSTPCAGKNWLLIGDAAGHVDPISGGGILYALWGAKLAAQAIGKGDLGSYDKLWREAYGDYLMSRCRSKEAFYDPLKSTLALLSGLANGSYFFGGVAR
jgi:geranylgeranyl reductase family protein